MQVLRHNVSLTDASDNGWVLFSLISTTLMFQYYSNHLLVSQLRTPVSVLPGNPPQELAAAAAENVLGTGDTLGCSGRQSFYV